MIKIATAFVLFICGLSCAKNSRRLYDILDAEGIAGHSTYWQGWGQEDIDRMCRIGKKARQAKWAAGIMYILSLIFATWAAFGPMEG